jgi:Z1 domain
MNISLYSSALAQCQLALAQMREDGGTALEREQIVDTVEEVLSMRRFRGGVDAERLSAELEEIFTIWSDAPSALGSDDDHQPWLVQKTPDIQWSFWNRYQLFLLHRQRMSPIALENLNRVTDEVLGRIEFPQRAGPWDRRGLVMGDVQSGKTGTYVGLICKAADAGYKVIVVLAGLHNNLRSQTQIRLDEGFLGYKAVPPAPDGATFEPTGAADFGHGLKADSVTNRHENGDFNQKIAQHFGIHPGGNPLLFVVKKNVSVLTNLLRYIQSRADMTDSATGRKYHRDTSLLVIDDEADQASVDTKAIAVDENGIPDEEHNPSETNRLIRKLLHSFNKSAYVAFTATPFANIFIHEKARTTALGDDLFPRSFIINLPAPSNYTGASRIFGIKEDEDVGLEEVEALPLVRTIFDHADSDEPNESRGWMPPRLGLKTAHVPLHQGKRAVPPSLATAIRSFLLAATVRCIREEGPIFNSMLVHVVRFTKVQNIVTEQVEDELRMIVDRLRLGDGTRRPTMVDELQALWDSDFVPTTERMGPPYRLPSWSEIANHLARVAGTIVVKAINGSAADSLEYEHHRRTGLNIIAIGGDKLSRGLTLDGLVTSYFLRSARMYDTLMQMGRWFGYREKYLDVCRLYMTGDLREWFGHIAAATEELRREFDYMVSVGASPKAYGLKVRSHPTLMITSATKMKSGTEMQLSYAGEISETILFDKSEDVIRNNAAAVGHLVERLGPPPLGGQTGGYVWKNAKAELVLDFAAEYASHPDARRADTRLLARYIRKQNEKGELKTWCVKLVSSGAAKETAVFNDLPKGLAVGPNTRAEYPADQARNRYSIRRLVSPADEIEDLDDTEREVALARSHLLWEKSTRKNKAELPPKAPSGQGIRYARPKHRGLLLIYPLDPSEAGSESTLPIFGMALSFPESDTAEPISYTVTNLFTQLSDYDDF